MNQYLADLISWVSKIMYWYHMGVYVDNFMVVGFLFKLKTHSKREHIPFTNIHFFQDNPIITTTPVLKSNKHINIINSSTESSKTLISSQSV